MTNAPLDIAELHRLLTVISPLPWWIEPEHAGHPLIGLQDAYIACGTRGDPTATYALMERYNVDTDYAYLAAAANILPGLLARLAAVEARAERLQILLEGLIDDERCWHDHNGYCQEHGYFTIPCHMAEARDYLQAMAAGIPADGEATP